MRFVQGLAMFAATLVAEAATIAATWGAAMVISPPDDTAKQADLTSLMAVGAVLVVAGAIGVWVLLFVLAAVKRLRALSAAGAGLAVGVGLAMVLMGIAGAWDSVGLVLAWGVPFPVAGGLAGWAVWRWLAPKAMPVEGVF